MGCVGSDHHGDTLKEVAEKAGLTTVYQIKQESSTGKCAILLTTTGRSMVASLGASQEFSLKQLEQTEFHSHIEKAQIICSEGFFIASSREAFMEVASYAHSHKKIFCMTLSAKYIVEKGFGNWLLAALQYADFVFGYEEVSIRESPKLLLKRPRTVLITRRTERTLVATKDNIKEYQWKSPPTIVDSHGCREAFAG
ncbi:unnamed protein product, partial [Didymodactylos carnosus]